MDSSFTKLCANLIANPVDCTILEVEKSGYGDIAKMQYSANGSSFIGYKALDNVSAVVIKTVYPSLIKKPSTSDPTSDPINLQILELMQVGDNVVAKIQYPDCNNFEGIKICVFKNTTTDDIKNRNIIDPHFADNPNAPVARFTPTIEGIWMAVNFAKYI